eukprot:EG_transcript_171
MAFPNCGNVASASSCDGQCQTGYSATSSVSASCFLGTLTYQGQCDPVPCPDPSNNLAHMVFPNCGPLTSGSSCGGQCQAGYTAVGSVSAYCLSGWLFFFGQCSPLPCGAPSPAVDQHVTFPACGLGPHPSGSSCAGECLAGYAGSVSAVCTAGAWAYAGQCTPAPCSAPSPPASLNVAFPKCGPLASSASCVGQCVAGHVTAGIISATCLMGNLTYSGLCSPAICSNLNVSGLVFPLCNPTHGTSCLGSCPPGHTAFGVISATCDLGTWKISGRCYPTAQTPTSTVTETTTTTATSTTTTSTIASQTLTPSVTQTGTQTQTVVTGFIRSSRTISGQRFPRLAEHALRSYLAYEECPQISASPQLPFAILGDRVSCRRLGPLTIIVDRVDGVQWVALSASVKTDVLNWITGFVNAMDSLFTGTLGVSVNQYVLQLLDDLQNVTTELDPTVPVRLTGHSLGGALAAALAMQLWSMGFQVDDVATFGAPKILHAVPEKLQQLLPILRRVTLEEDPIPAFPPLASYIQAGPEMRLLTHPGDYEELATKTTADASSPTDEFWSVLGHLKEHNMANYISRLSPFLSPADTFLSKAVATISKAEQSVAGQPTKTLSYPFHWHLLFQDNRNSLLRYLCAELHICEVTLSTTITVHQWTEAQVDMQGAILIQPPWNLGLANIHEVDVGLQMDVVRPGEQASVCTTFNVALKGDSDLFGMLQKPIKGLIVECTISCDGFVFTVRIQSWSQPFGIPWMDLRNLVFYVSKQNLQLAVAFSGQVVLFGNASTFSAVYRSSGMLGMSIGYPDPIPTVSLRAMTTALCSCELPDWANTLLSVAEFFGVQGQFLKGSLEPFTFENVTLRPGFALSAVHFSLFWGLLRGSASIAVSVDAPRGWTLAVTLDEVQFFNGIVTLGPLFLDVAMTEASSHLRFSGKGSITLVSLRTIAATVAVEVAGNHIAWDVEMSLGLLHLSSRISTALVEPTDLPIDYPIDSNQAQSEVDGQRQSWLQDRIQDLANRITNLWDQIWAMVSGVAAFISWAVKVFLGLGRKFQIQAACPPPDLAASPTGLAALTLGLDVAVGCGGLHANAYLQRVLSRVPLSHAHPILRCFTALPSSVLPSQLTVSVSGTMNISAMTDVEASQLLKFVLWYWPEQSMSLALGCLVANLSNAAMWESVDAVLAGWPDVNNSSAEDVQEKFLEDLEKKGLDPNNSARALQALQVLATLGDCGANQTAEDYQRCVQGDTLSCPMFFIGSWRQRECSSTAAVAQQVLRGLAPGLGAAPAGKARGMQPLDCGWWCQQVAGPIKAYIDRVHNFETLHNNLASSFPSLIVNTVKVAGNVRTMASITAITLHMTGTFKNTAFDRLIQVNPTDPMREWMKAIWSSVSDDLYFDAARSAAAKWRPAAADPPPAALCQGGGLLRPPSLDPNSDEAELWAYWNATYGAGGRTVIDGPSDDQILAGYRSPAFLNNSWRLCDPICGTCDDIGYRIVDPATNATVFRTAIPDFVPPGYNGTPAPPVFDPVVLPVNDTAFAAAPIINTSQASVSIPVYVSNQYTPACVEQPAPPLPCDHCGAVGWPRNCPPATPAAVMGCVVDVVSQADVPLSLQAITLAGLGEATVNVSRFVTSEWQFLGSTRVSPGAAALFAFPGALLLPPNGTLRLWVMADRPDALPASPTYEVWASTFAQADVMLTAVDTWTSVSTRLASPKQCHLSVEVCR